MVQPDLWARDRKLCPSLRNLHPKGRTDHDYVGYRGCGCGVAWDPSPKRLYPLEDSGYFLMNVQLPDSASLQRTEQVLERIGGILEDTPGVQYVTAIGGYNIISQTFTTYNAVIFVSLKPWENAPLMKSGTDQLSLD